MSTLVPIDNITDKEIIESSIIVVKGDEVLIAKRSIRGGRVKDPLYNSALNHQINPLYLPSIPFKTIKVVGDYSDNKYYDLVLEERKEKMGTKKQDGVYLGEERNPYIGQKRPLYIPKKGPKTPMFDI